MNISTNEARRTRRWIVEGLFGSWQELAACTTESMAIAVAGLLKPAFAKEGVEIRTRSAREQSASLSQEAVVSN